NPRYISNRVFNSLGVDLFSERNVSQLAWVWGQSLDHTFGNALSGGEEADIAFDSSDPLESFTNSSGMIAFQRDQPAAGGGVRNAVNTVNSYIDGWLIYGGTTARLDWLRTGGGDGSGARMLLPGNYLPLASQRGDVATAPPMVTQGML